MSQLEKLWERIKNNPKTVRFEELEKMLLKAGFKETQPRSGSTHYTFKKNGKRITVPYKQPYIKREYVEQAIEAIGSYFDD